MVLQVLVNLHLSVLVLSHQLKGKVVNLEMENENFENSLRMSESIIMDLEQKLDTSLEEVALLQSELEEIKNHSQEQIERLKQQVEETNLELQIKEREMKKMKFMQLIKEKPATIESYSHSISLLPHPQTTRNQQNTNKPFARFRTIDNGSISPITGNGL